MSNKDIGVFEEWPFKTPHIKTVIKKIEAFAKAFSNATSEKEAYSIYKKYSHYSDKVADQITHIQVLYTLYTQKEEYVKAQNLLAENGPALSSASLLFSKALVSSPYRSYLESKLGSHLFTILDYQIKSFDPRLEEDAVKENKLVMKYQALTASAQIEFQGGVHTLSQMGKFLVDPDRHVRKEASALYYSFLSGIKDQLEDIYDQLVKLRDHEAKLMGYKNYVELGYLRMNRFDYSKEDVARYREEINQVVTPIANKLFKQDMKRCGISTPKVYDLGMMFKDGNPTPFGDTNDKIESAKKMYSELSSDASTFFNFMADHHLLDLEARAGKSNGGYMTYFPMKKCPFIFSNFNGTSGDVDVLTHEFGHSFQSYCARNIKVPEYRAPTYESCEIDSMAMEFFAEPWMNLFFKEPTKYRYEHLASSISFLPYGVTVDEFQEWVYENPEATPAQRDEKWHELEVKYTPWKAKAYKGCSYMESGHRWLMQLHIFELPFYYVDYTLAQVLAFEFFNLDRKNHEKAWKKYVKLNTLGGRLPFRSLLAKTGLKDPFVTGTVKKTIHPLVKLLKDYNVH